MIFPSMIVCMGCPGAGKVGSAVGIAPIGIPAGIGGAIAAAAAAAASVAFGTEVLGVLTLGTMSIRKS